MIGIYKITNKNSNKSYIGQSIHCGKRLDEHCKGEQLIDEIIQIEGIENFSFEIIKEVEKEQLLYWEDYFIIKYNTMFPNGYNKRWNCNKNTRNEIKNKIMQEIAKEVIKEDIILKQINNIEEFLNTLTRKRFYLYCYLYYNSIHEMNKIYWKKNKLTKSFLEKCTGLTRQTISKYLNDFEKMEIITQDKDKFLIKNIEQITNFLHIEDVENLTNEELYILWKIRKSNSDNEYNFYLYELSDCKKLKRKIDTDKIKKILNNLIDKKLIIVKFPDCTGKGGITEIAAL